MAIWSFEKDPVEWPDDLKKSKAQAELILRTIKEAGLPLSSASIALKTGYKESGVRTVLYALQKQTHSVRLISLEDRKTANVEDLLKFDSIQRWLRALKNGPGRKTDLYNMNRYMEYVRSK